MELVGELLELPVSERNVRLKDICARDESLGIEIKSLLGAAPDAADLFPEAGRIAYRLESADVRTTMPQRTDALVPIIDGYEVGNEIGRGGQGIVYSARQLSTARMVALKVLPSLFAAETRQRARFEREVELAAQLRHPNIASVYDSGTSTSGLPYIVMALVDGERLDRYVARIVNTTSGIATGLRPDLALPIFLRIADAVAHAHQRGVLHRDLKPSNVLIDSEGHPHLLDFGLARAIDRQGDASNDTITLPGVFMGTPHYASPEQREGRWSEVDVQSDVYSLGVMLFEMLTGSLPHTSTGRGVISTETSVVCKPSSANAAIDEDLDAIALRTIDLLKERRYLSVFALVNDIKRYQRGEPIDARRGQRVYSAKKWVRRHWVGTMVAMLIGILSIIAAATLHSSNRKLAKAVHEKALLLGLQQSRSGDTQAERTLFREFSAAEDGSHIEWRARWALREHNYHNPWLGAWNLEPDRHRGITTASAAPRLAFWQRGSREISIVDVPSGLAVGGSPIRTVASVTDAVLTAAGETLLVAMSTGEIVSYALSRSGISGPSEFRGADKARPGLATVQLQLSPDGAWVAVRDSLDAKDQHLSVYASATRDIKWEEAFQEIGGMAFSPDSRRFAVGASSMRVIDLDSTTIREISPPDEWTWDRQPIASKIPRFFQPHWTSNTAVLVRWHANYPCLDASVRWIRWHVDDSSVHLLHSVPVRDIYALHPGDRRRAYSRDAAQLHELTLDSLLGTSIVRRNTLGLSGSRITGGPDFVGGDRIAAISYASGELRLLDTLPGVLRLPIGRLSTIHHIEILEDPDRIALATANNEPGSFGEIIIFDTKNRRICSRTRAHRTATTCVRARGERLISTGQDGFVKEWIKHSHEGRALQEVRPLSPDYFDPFFPGSPDESAWCAFDPAYGDEHLIAFAYAGITTLRPGGSFVRIARAAQRPGVEQTTHLSSFAIDSEGSRAYIALKHHHGGGIQPVNLTGQSDEQDCIWFDGAAYGIDLRYRTVRGRQRSELAVACSDGIVRLVDPHQSKITRELAGHSGSVYSVDYATIDGRVVLASGGSNGEIFVWDPERGDLLARFDDRAPDAPNRLILSVAFDEQNMRLLAGASHGRLYIIDLPSLDERAGNLARYWLRTFRSETH